MIQQNIETYSPTQSFWCENSEQMYSFRMIRPCGFIVGQTVKLWNFYTQVAINLVEDVDDERPWELALGRQPDIRLNLGMQLLG